VRVTEQELREALTVRQRRRVRRDSTLSLGGTVYEVPLGYLAGQIVTVATSLFDGTEPVIELDDKRIPLTTVDAIANGKKARPRRRPEHQPPATPVDFDPGRTLSTDIEEDVDDHLF
jgi:hypothetical protein